MNDGIFQKLLGFMLQFLNRTYMYSTSSTQMLGKNKKTVELETGIEFPKEEMYSLEIEAEREYVHRLKVQREKIEALYAKYDFMLEDTKKKDQKIRDLEKRIGELNSKCKEYSLLTPETDLLKKQNIELSASNEALRFQVMEIEQSFKSALNECKSRLVSSEKERERAEEFNEQLVLKVRMFQQKTEDRQVTYEGERKSWAEKMEELQRQLCEARTKSSSESSALNSEVLSRDEKIDVLLKENKQLREALVQWQENSNTIAQYNEERLEKLQAEYKLKVKSIKQDIEEQLYSNEIMENKIATMALQIEKLTTENTELRRAVQEEKQRGDELLYDAKLTFNQEKSLLREHTMQLESKLTKLEKQLGESLKRERDLMGNIRRLEESEQVKKSLREVERRELEKINRLLLLEK